MGYIQARIDNDFKFHPATPETGPRHARIRRLCHALAVELVQEVPEGREQSLALTALEETMMWANAGIARASARAIDRAVEVSTPLPVAKRIEDAVERGTFNEERRG
jgi:hypothetical protein